MRPSPVLFSVCLVLGVVAGSLRADDPPRIPWLWTTATAVPSKWTSEESGYFSLVEGKNGKLYLGAAKYGANAYLLEVDPAAPKEMKVVIDAQKEIGNGATGFAAQAKFHTRNNVGSSGKIYVGTKQGYPKEGEKRSEYLGGYPMVYDPATGKTRTYPIPVPNQGVISVTPDESRGVAYISTCSDERPTESAHFMILDLESGKYRDLGDTRHMYAFIVVDHLGRAYHPWLGGEIGRYDPRTDKLQMLKQTIDGQPITQNSPHKLLADPKSHPINWDISPDGKTLWAVAMSGNALYSYDLTGDGDTLAGKFHGPLIPAATATDCRAMCVGPDGTVWAGIAATYGKEGQWLELVSYKPGDQATKHHGRLAIQNPDYTKFTDDAGKELRWHHGVHRPTPDGPLVPRYTIMAIAAAKDGTVYMTTLYPFTLHAVKVKP